VASPAVVQSRPFQAEVASAAVVQSRPFQAEVASPAVVQPRPFHAGAAFAATLITSPDVPFAVVEQYRKLGAALHQDRSLNGTRVVLITSALPTEGKTVVASNTALVLSRSFSGRVLLLDADLRRPAVHTVFGLENHSGLSERLSGERPGNIVPVAVSSRLSVIPAGRAQTDPLRLVSGDAMRQLMLEFSATYDWVIVDTPPVGLMPDAHLLASMADRVLMVIRGGKTPHDAIAKAVELIGRERVLGAVLNHAEQAIVAPYGQEYDSYYYGEHRE
jgi:capsular exopolysaccharide synthesis family protein